MFEMAIESRLARTKVAQHQHYLALTGKKPLHLLHQREEIVILSLQIGFSQRRDVRRLAALPQPQELKLVNIIFNITDLLSPHQCW